MAVAASNVSSLVFLVAAVVLLSSKLPGSVSGRVHQRALSAGPQLCEAHNVSSSSASSLPQRDMGQDKCSESDLVIDQGPSSPLPNGIPTYSVSILNACSSGCTIGKIHLKCGKFASARLIDPDVFRRLDYDDCLVYGGRPIPNGMTLSFEYDNTYPYPMDVSQYECCPAASR